jgi:hypothetical protein
MEVLLEEVRRGLDLDGLRILFKDEISLSVLSGTSALVSFNSDPFCHLSRLGEGSHGTWRVSVDIYCDMRSREAGSRNGKCAKKSECVLENEECERGSGRVVGEILACKPAWKRRRASERDEELLQMLADGLGRWFARQVPTGHVARPRVLVADRDQTMQGLVRSNP